MGPNESWMSDVERELKRAQDQLAGLSVNQLALQSQGNYELPSRVQQPEQVPQQDELIWIKLTDKIAYYGQWLYSWRKQIKTLTPAGYVWSDSGDASTYSEYPAVGLNNDDVAVGTEKRYPAKWNPDTSQWLFFSSQEAASSTSFIRWNNLIYMNCSFTTLPTFASGASANLTMDQQSLDAAINFLQHCHICNNYRQKYLSYSTNTYWDGLFLGILGEFGTYPPVSSANTTNWNNYLVSWSQGGAIGYFPDGVPSGNYGGRILSNVPASYFVPRIDSYNKNVYNNDEAMGDYPWDVYDQFAPGTYSGSDQTSYSGNFFKSAWCKKHRANGTWDGSSVYQLVACATYSSASQDGVNWSVNFGPVRGTVGYYTNNMTGGGTGSGYTYFNTFNGTLTVSWGSSICSSSGLNGNVNPNTP